MIRLTAVGDLMLGDSATTVGFGLRSRYPGAQLSEVFAELAPRLQNRDIVIGNLECPLTATGVGESRWARDQMRGDAAYARVLRQTGFTAIAVANNHAMQHGDVGFYQTVEALRTEGLLVLGLRGTKPWHSEPVSYTHSSGATVIMLGYSRRPRQYGLGTPGYADADEAGILDDVARARALSDSVVVSLHWGVEFVNRPSESEVRFARALANAGAQVVVGHHPHVVRPVETLDGAIIAYSLGNCVTDMLWSNRLREGALLEVDLAPRQANARVTATRVDDDYRVRVYSETTREPDQTASPLETSEYERLCDVELRKQRTDAYRYAARNLFRYSPATLVRLVGTTATNKWQALAHRVRGSA